MQSSNQIITNKPTPSFLQAGCLLVAQSSAFKAPKDYDWLCYQNATSPLIVYYALREEKKFGPFWVINPSVGCDQPQRTFPFQYCILQYWKGTVLCV